jgi:hypothetical protein
VTRAEGIAALVPLAGMIRDLALADVARASAARQRSLDRLVGLEAPAAEGLDPVDEARTALRYQVWADQRRMEILPVLERETEALVQAETEARRAFGRAEALKGLSLRSR